MGRGLDGPLRVLHINTEWRLRGGEQQTIALASALAARGHRSALVCQPGSPVARAASENGVPTFPVRMRADADLLAVGAIAGLLRRGKVDIIHTHSSHALGLGALAAPFGGRPARVHTRRIASTILRRSALRFNRWKYVLGTDVCIGISRAVVRQLVEDGIPEDRVALVPSGVDLPNNGVSLRRDDLGIPGGAALLGNISSLEEEKGVDILIDAFAIVARTRPDGVLLIVGDGPDRGALEGRAWALGLKDRVRFLGQRPDVQAILPLLDLYVSTSRREALGTSILSAQAHRLPVVATRVGGVPEVIRDGETGLLAPPGAHEEVADRILRLLRDPSLRHRLGRAGRERVAREYSTEGMVSGTLGVYGQVLGARRRCNGF